MMKETKFTLEVTFSKHTMVWFLFIICNSYFYLFSVGEIKYKI
jgi:hypothetical protein